MAAKQVALLDDAALPAYEDTPSNVQEHAPTASNATQAWGEVGSSQNESFTPVGRPLQNPPEYFYQGQAVYPLQQEQPTAITTHNVTVMQPGCTTVVPAVYPDDNRVYAWFVCLCCFWPLGIAAIIHANRARDAIIRGDYVTAMTESKMSRKFSYWAIGAHFIGGAIATLVLIVFFASFSANSQ